MRDSGSHGWPPRIGAYLKHLVIDADDHLDAARARFRQHVRTQQPRMLAAYRGYGDDAGVHLMGRALADRPRGGPLEDAAWWDNLLQTYRRFESDEIPGLAVRLQCHGEQQDVVTDGEGYYQASLQPSPGWGEPDALWTQAIAQLQDGQLATLQPVLRVPEGAGIGIISDIDDTVLHSGITSLTTAAQLTFLHNARTRKPLPGVAALYRGLQAGTGPAPAPLFYVSSSPYNLYDLLDDFMALNGIPPGPIFLRDLGLDTDKFIKTAGHGHKLERALALIERFPLRRWILLGDSGQADAELYAEAARLHGDRIAAIYIRDVDPDGDSTRDLQVDGHIHRIAGTGVPMLRVADSLAIAEHAIAHGLLDASWHDAVAREVTRDHARPSLTEAAFDPKSIPST